MRALSCERPIANKEWPFGGRRGLFPSRSDRRPYRQRWLGRHGKPGSREYPAGAGSSRRARAPRYVFRVWGGWRNDFQSWFEKSTLAGTKSVVTATGTAWCIRFSRKSSAKIPVAPRDAIESAIRARSTGLRAPSFSVTRNSLWALEILSELGFAYDSSIFPVRHDFYGIPGHPRFSFQLRTKRWASLVELPMSTVRCGQYEFTVCGGAYLRIFPCEYTRRAFRRVNEGEQRPAIVYFHPWEIDPEQPTAEASAEIALPALHQSEWHEEARHQSLANLRICAAASSFWSRKSFRHVKAPMTETDSNKVLDYWDRSVAGFDAIYTGKKPGWCDCWTNRLRRRHVPTLRWVMENSGDVMAQAFATSAAVRSLRARVRAGRVPACAGR